MEYDLRAGVGLVLNCEEGNSLASLASSTSSSDTVDIVLDCQGELYGKNVSICRESFKVLVVGRQHYVP